MSFPDHQRQRLIPVSVFAISLLCFHGIFSVFFPTPAGLLGHDYALAIPNYYDGLLWFSNNSWWQLPWFSPSFCGGQPFYADPQSGYLSLPQWLFFVLPPVPAVYLSLLILASMGYWGSYQLARVTFNCSLWAASLAGVLFMFNSFLAHRWIIGHAGFQGFVLIPWIALVLTMPRELPFAGLRWGGNALLAALMVAFWVQSAFGSIMIPAALAVAGVAALAVMGGQAMLPIVTRGVTAGLLALLLSAAKLTAGFSFLAHFGRADYALPGFPGFLVSLKMAAAAMTLPSEWVAEMGALAMVNQQWLLSAHEWSYSTTPVPVVLLLAGLCLRTLAPGRFLPTGVVPWLALALLAVICLLPIAFNVYTPGWNTFLKQLPLIGNNSSLVRWYLVYIPLMIIGCVWLLDQVVWWRRYRAAIAVVCIAAVIVFSALENRQYYFNAGSSYSPQSATLAWRNLKASETVVPVRGVSQRAVRGDVELLGNDVVFAGLSQPTCYNPVFGYQLEYLPLEPLKLGPVTATVDGVFNFKNPACYVYPDANQCQPGDHFQLDEGDALSQFTAYRPYPFAISKRQQWADRTTLVTLLLILLGCAGTAVQRCYFYWQQKGMPGWK